MQTRVAAAQRRASNFPPTPQARERVTLSAGRAATASRLVRQVERLHQAEDKRRSAMCSRESSSPKPSGPTVQFACVAALDMHARMGKHADSEPGEG